MKAFVFLAFFFTHTLLAETQPIRVILDWYLNSDHAPLFVAQEKGYFKQEGISVEIIQPADTAEGPKMVAAEQADLALTYQPGFLQQADIGLPLVRVASLINHPLESILVLKNGPIHHIADLKGKTVGYSNPAADIFMLQMMLQPHHLSLDDIHTINVRFSLLHALLTGNIDAISGGMRNVEPILMKLNGHPARSFYPEENGIPPYDELIFVANKKNLSDPRLKKFFIALKKGANYLKKHPKSTWKAFAKAHPEKGEMSRLSWFASIPYFSQNPTELDAKKYDSFMMFMWENHAISRQLALSEYTYNV